MTALSHAENIFVKLSTDFMDLKKGVAENCGCRLTLEIQRLIVETSVTKLLYKVQT